MHFLEYYYQSVIKYDLLNKFQYSTLKNVPQIKKIILNFECDNFELKELSTSLLALELIAFKKGKLIFFKNSKMFIKIRKGNLKSCRVELQKNFIYYFLTKSFLEIFPKLKKFSFLNLRKKELKNSTVSNKYFTTFTFFELEHNYSLFNNLKSLNITIVTNTFTQKELIFLLNSFKISTNI